MVTIGIIGLGFMAATHVRAYQQIQGARIGALCNPSGRNLNGDFSGVSGNIDTGTPLQLDMAKVSAYKEVDQLLADPGVDLIDICTPTAHHADLAVRALQAGKHVLCEKPMARTVADARRIVEAARPAQGFFMPAMCLRFWPEWSWLKQAITETRYGNVLGARFRRVAEPPAWGQSSFFNGAQSGGALFDLHIHDTDFVQFCFGLPRRVFARGYSKLSGAVDHVITQYDVEGGAVVHAEGGWAMTPGFGFNMSYTVNFENATADYDISRAEQALLLFEKDKEKQVLKCEGPDGFASELRYLVDCIEKGTPPSVVTAQDGLASVQICACEEESVGSGQPVDVPGAN